MRTLTQVDQDGVGRARRVFLAALSASALIATLVVPARAHDLPGPETAAATGAGIGTIIVACIFFCIPTPWPIL